MSHCLPPALRLALIFVAFQAAWFACILGAAHDRAWLGVGAVALVVGAQISTGGAVRQDARLVGLAIVMGLLWDTALLHWGVVRYAAPGPIDGLAPVWILALWALLGVNLRETLSWLHGRRWLAAAIGAVSGALSYVGAIRLGAGQLPDTPLAVCVLALGWAVMTPVLTESARRAAAESHRPQQHLDHL